MDIDTTNSPITQSPKGTLLETGQEVSFSLPLVNALNPINLILLVPGTTDPINLHFTSNVNANSGDYYKDRETGNGFYKEVIDIKKNIQLQFPSIEYDNLVYVEDSKFTWSGDNSDEERTKAANILADLILKEDKTFLNWHSRDVYIHLIGHSHGGNVINEFTKVINNRSNFPDSWSIKSIMYLNTPFFNDSHQVDESKLHDDCEIYNVYNDYDLTARVIADHSVIKLAEQIEKFKKRIYFKKAKQYFNDLDFETFLESFKKLKDDKFNIEDLIKIWRQLANIFRVISLSSKLSISVINKSNSSVLHNFKRKLINVKDFSTPVYVKLESRIANQLNEIQQDPDRNFFEDLVENSALYWFKKLYDDLGIEIGFDWVNSILDIFYTGHTPSSSYLLNILEAFLVSDIKILKNIENTELEPNNRKFKQFKKFENNVKKSEVITSNDPYNSRNSSKNYNSFISKLENLIISGNTSTNTQTNYPEILLLLLSQLIQLDKNNVIKKNISYINDFNASFQSHIHTFGIGVIEFIELRSKLSDFIQSINRHYLLIDKNNKNLMDEQDLSKYNGIGSLIKNLIEIPGSIGYLSLKSHNLSRTFMSSYAKDFLKKALVLPENAPNTEI